MNQGYLIQPCSGPSREQPGNKVGAVWREFEQCLIDEVFEHVLAADIEDKGDLRSRRRNVREVLLRSDTEIYAGRLNALFQIRNDVRKFTLIRHELKPEVSTLFRELVDRAPESLRRKFAGNRVGRTQEKRHSQDGAQYREGNSTVHRAHDATIHGFRN